MEDEQLPRRKTYNKGRRKDEEEEKEAVGRDRFSRIESRPQVQWIGMCIGYPLEVGAGGIEAGMREVGVLRTGAINQLSAGRRPEDDEDE